MWERSPWLRGVVKQTTMGKKPMAKNCGRATLARPCAWRDMEVAIVVGHHADGGGRATLAGPCAWQDMGVATVAGRHGQGTPCWR